MQPRFLDTIALTVKRRLAAEAIPLDSLRKEAAVARKPQNFLKQFKSKAGPRIIAEVKFASPALGQIAKGDPVEIAKQYRMQGASAISVLTEPDYFQGSKVYLKQIREALPEALLLMKDFVLDESQLLQARILGADAVLLIVAFLEFNQLQCLYNRAIELGLTPLVEVHTLSELKLAKVIGARLIGINNRNLHTLKVDLSTSRELIKHADGDACYISESGIQTATDVIDLQQRGYQGFLIGGQLMKQPNPGLALQCFLQDIANES